MKKIIHVIILFLVCTTAFSQNPDPPDFEDPTDDNPTDVPIDGQMPIMLIAAIFFGIYIIGRKKLSQF